MDMMWRRLIHQNSFTGCDNKLSVEYVTFFVKV